MGTPLSMGVACALLGTATMVAQASRGTATPVSLVSEVSRNSCEALRKFQQPDVSIVDAGIVPAGEIHKNDMPQGRGGVAAAPPGLPVSGAPPTGRGGGAGNNRLDALRVPKAFCRVEARIEGNIGFLAWLPLREDWNGRMLGVGNGGDAGSFQTSGVVGAVRAGMVGITTDAGHQGNTDPLWAMSRKKYEDYSHRAQHLTAVLGRELTVAYYGSDPRKSYFSGCSGGGRQALTEMQVFPEDYDGIIAGAPAAQHNIQMARKQWLVRLAEDDPQGALSDAKWNMVVAEVIKQCDPIDGLTDGLVENPMACKFDVKTLACKPGVTGDNCLTQAQVGMVDKVYGPFKDENGVERGPRPAPGIKPITAAPITGVHAFGYAVHQNPNWTRKDLVIGRDIDLLDRLFPVIGPNNPDLTNFVKRRGKAIIYQGLADPTDTVTYNMQNYDRIVAYATNGGLKKVQDAVRLFLAANIGHCGGANAPSWQSPGQAGYNPAGDPLQLMIRWVEEGKAPDQILASQVRDGNVVRTRPLCVYPAIAQYKGSGSIDQAENFVCR
jgi:feruloyl esterase